MVAWVIESVVPEKLSGEETVAVCTPLVPLPTRMPESVVEPVPPCATASALPSVRVPTVAALNVAELANALVEDAVMAKKLVVVALVPVALPKAKRPVSVVEAEESPPLNAMSVVVALFGNG